jgi:EmrB/QacA subfamily drug resistance transporter
MDENVAQVELSDRERTVTMVGILTAMLLAALDQSIVTPAMPTIGGDLGNSQYLPWVVTAYLLSATAVAPLYGKISDIHGRRITFYTALGLFLSGSVIAALVPNMFVLIAARAIQGLGGGGLFALSQIVIGDMMPPRERGRYAAWISGMWAVAGISGPLLGGTLAEVYWPLIFWINLPLGILAMIVINRPLKRLAFVARPHRLDTAGAALVVLATGTLLLALNWAGKTYAWTSPVIIALGLLSLAFWVAFGIRLSRASEPLVSLEVLSNRIVLTACAGSFLVAGSNIGLAVYLPVYAQAYLGFSPAQSGYSLLGFLLGTVAGATLSGRLTLHVDRIKRIAIIGAAISALAFVATGLLDSRTPIAVLESALVLIGFGMGLTFPVTTVSVQNGVDPMHLGVATGMMIFLRSLGSALGVALLGALALSNGIPLGAESETGKIVRVTSAGAFTVLYHTMAGMMLAAAVMYVLMPHKSLRGRVPAPQSRS